MARFIPTDTYDEVIEAIARFPDDASIEQIEETLTALPNRRTLQRWFNSLIAQERVHRKGRGRAIKYQREQRRAPRQPCTGDRSGLTRSVSSSEAWELNAGKEYGMAHSDQLRFPGLSRALS